MMAHKRIRPSNTRDTYPEQELDNDLAQVMAAGNFIYLCGQCPQDLDTAEGSARQVGICEVSAFV